MPSVREVVAEHKPAVNAKLRPVVEEIFNTQDSRAIVAMMVSLNELFLSVFVSLLEATTTDRQRENVLGVARDCAKSTYQVTHSANPRVTAEVLGNITPQ